MGDRGKVECGTPSSRLIIGKREPLELKTEIIPVDQALLAAGQHHGSTFYQHQAFLKAIREGTEPEVTLEDGRRAVAMGVAAERSIKTGEPVIF